MRNFNSPTEALLALAKSTDDPADVVWREWLLKNMRQISLRLRKSRWQQCKLAIGDLEDFQYQLSKVNEETQCRMFVRLMAVAREKLTDGRMLWQTPEWGVFVVLPLTRIDKGGSLANEFQKTISPSWIEEGITFGGLNWSDKLVRSFFCTFCYTLINLAKNGPDNDRIHEEITNCYIRLLDGCVLDKEVYKEVAGLVAETLLILGAGLRSDCGHNRFVKIIWATERNEKYLEEINEGPLLDFLAHDRHLVPLRWRMYGEEPE